MLKYCLFYSLVIGCLIGHGAELCLPKSGVPVPISGFLTTHGGWPAETTIAYISYAESGLLLQIDGTVQAGRGVRRDCHNDDDFAIFSDELVEVFLLPDRFRQEGREVSNRDQHYFHLAYNLNGNGYTARRRDLSWNPAEVSCRSEVSAQGWSMRLQIPWAALETSLPPDGAVWQLNVARTRQGVGLPAEVASWTGAANFHEATQMGRLVFGKSSTQPVVVFREVVTTAPQISAVVQLDGEIPAGARLRMLADGVELAAQTVPAERPAQIRLESAGIGGELPLKETRQLTFRLSASENAPPLWEKSGRRQVDWQNLLELDRYFYNLNDRMLRYRLDPTVLSAMPVNGEIELQIYTERPLPRFSRRRITTRDLIGELPLGGLPEGRLLLRAVFTINGQTFETYRAFQLRPDGPPAPPFPGGRLRTERERLLIGNKPVFLLGASPTGKTFLHGNDCFNLALANYGLQTGAVLAPILPGQKFVRRAGWVGYHYDDWEKLRVGWQAAIQNEPADQPLFHRIAYEATMGAASLNTDGSLTEHRPAEWYARVYHELKRLSPHSLFSLHIDQPTRIREFADSCDIFQVAFWESSYAPFMLSCLDADMQQVRQEVPRKPILFWLGGTIPHNRCRSGEELLAAANLAVLNEFNGVVIHMGHGYLPEERSRVWSVLSGLNREIQAVFELYQGAGRNVRADMVAGEQFRLAARRRGRVTTVIAVNLRGSSNTLTFTSEDAVSLPLQKQALSGNTDFFTPYEAKLYRISAR